MTKFLKYNPRLLVANGFGEDENENINVIDLEEAVSIVKDLDYTSLNNVIRNFTFQNSIDLYINLQNSKVFFVTNNVKRLGNHQFMIGTISVSNENIFDVHEIIARLYRFYKAWSIK